MSVTWKRTGTLNKNSTIDVSHVVIISIILKWERWNIMITITLFKIGRFSHRVLFWIRVIMWFNTKYNFVKVNIFLCFKFKSQLIYGFQIKKIFYIIKTPEIILKNQYLFQFSVNILIASHKFEKKIMWYTA